MRFGGNGAARRKNVALTALLAVCFLSGQLAGFRHLAEVQHTRCAEHDELIDLPQSSPVAGAAVRSDGGSRVAAAPESGSDHRHEHCALGPQHRNDALIQSPQRVVQDAPPASGGAGPSDRAASFVGRAVYRIAPKASPPV